MAGRLWQAVLAWLRRVLFFGWGRKEMEVACVGLEGAGKTSLVAAIAGDHGPFLEDRIPTVGLNVRNLTRGRLTMRMWDLGGQPRYRGMWQRYCRGTSAVLYVVDAADSSKLPDSRSELHRLMQTDSLRGIPLLVLANKIDLLPPTLISSASAGKCSFRPSSGLSSSCSAIKSAATVHEKAFIDSMDLPSIPDREVCCLMISCRDSINIDLVLNWLIKHAK